MTDEQKKLLNNFEARVRQLMLLCESLREENALLKRTVAQKEEEILVVESSYKELLSRYDNLKLAQGIAMSEEERRNAKARYTKLVREIDKCIALLNE
ncbi:MAG: hypothetical protein Q8909_11375 [Bacteroidota bacterium]|jgi:hypothetical protein|nr:hypothetical protein [Bacteroidota bacterium]